LGFGNAAAGGFGQQQQQQPAAGGLFGNAVAKPAAGGLFGAGAAGATGGFGGFGQTSGALGGLNTGAAGAGGLGGFGAKPTLGATGGFGALGGGLGQQPALGGATGGFGALGGGGGLGMMGQQQGSYNLPTQGGLTSFGTNNLQNGLIATIDNNTYGSNPLFDLAGNRNPNYNKLNTPAEATAVAVSGANERHKSTHFPASPRVVSRIKLRGFTFPTKGSGVTRVTSSLNNNVDTDQDAMLGTQAFRNKPLFFDGNETENVAQTLAQTSRKKVTFNTDLEHGSFTSSPVLASSPAPSPLATPARVDDNVAAAESEGYLMTPSYQQLVTMSRDQLKSVQLTVTRQGFGTITFDQPVDLSDVPLSQIMGHFIVIQNKTIVVYPEQVRKPSPGQQLNVPATITLENCYTTDKHTGTVLTDPQHPRVAAFIKKLQDRPNVEFVDYDASSSKWTFKVKSF
jgi:nuclear pore complex protein Nup98-Nup96